MWPPTGRTRAIAAELAQAMMEDYGMRKKAIQLVSRAPEKRRAVWEKFGITPRGIDRETSEMMHRTHMGVDNNWQTLLLQGMRNALSDGWGGSMIATEVSDILFGIPAPGPPRSTPASSKRTRSTSWFTATTRWCRRWFPRPASPKNCWGLAKAKGAAGINLVGVCCTGNELLMRRGIAMAGNHLMTELILSTGAVDMMIVDYQCIMPSVGKVAGLLPHQDDLHQRQGPVPRHGARGVPPGQRPRKGRGSGGPDGSGKLHQPQGKVFIPVEPQEAVGGFRWRPSWGRWAGPRSLSSRPSRRARSGAPWASWAATTPRSSTTTAM
jgi:carbon-monoxide dehydrogenase catalytic subunit